MKFEQSKNFNINYAAKIVQIDTFRQHSNPEVLRLKCCSVDGFNVIVGIDTEPGKYIYFPAGCKINNDFLSINNLYKDKTLNKDSEKFGMFESKGRVKPINLKGENSEGFICPIEYINNWLNTTDDISCEDVIDFDSIDGKIICKKYIIQPTKLSNPEYIKIGKNPSKSQAVHILDNQFKFHVDTTLIKKVPHVIKPDSLISITNKKHGTSGISAMLLQEFPVKESWKDKIIRKLSGSKIPIDIKYSDVCSSRKVIKDPINNSSVESGYYGTDIWNIAHKELLPHLSNGLSLYYEIIGYLPTGAYIQKGYDYGYEAPKSGQPFKLGINYGIEIYRITYTNNKGVVYEFSAKQVQQWCKSKNLKAVEEFYYGYAKDLYPDLNVENNWNENFIKLLSEDKRFFMEMNSPDCNNEVPHEGIVIRNESLNIEVYKLKCMNFLLKESKALDNGEFDIES